MKVDWRKCRVMCKPNVTSAVLPFVVFWVFWGVFFLASSSSIITPVISMPLWLSLQTINSVCELPLLHLFHRGLVVRQSGKANGS